MKGALSETLAELTTLNNNLQAEKDLGKNVEYLNTQLADRLPRLRQLETTLKSLRVESLLSMYGKVEAKFISIKPRNEDDPKDDAAFSDIVKTALSYLKAVNEGAKEAVAAATGEKDALVSKFKNTLNEGLEDVEKFQERVSALTQTLNSKMESLVSEARTAYANTVQKYGFVLGLGVCLAINADCVSIYRSLSRDPQLAASVFENSGGYTNQPMVQSLSAPIDNLSALTTDLRNVARSLSTHDAQKAKFANDFAGFYAAFESTARLMTNAAAEVRRGETSTNATLAVDFTAVMKPAQSAQAAANEEQFFQAVNEADLAVAGLARDYGRINAYSVERKVSELTSTPIPLGWHDGRWKALWLSGGFWESLSQSLMLWEKEAWLQIWAVFTKLLGLTFTAFLISFGSGFWNDLLKSLLGLRGTLQKTGK